VVRGKWPQDVLGVLFEVRKLIKNKTGRGGGKMALQKKKKAPKRPFQN